MIPRLYINGNIGEEISDKLSLILGIEPSTKTFGLKSVEKFLSDNKDATDLEVEINSCGGDVDEGFLMYDKLVESGKNIITIGSGRVYSIATVIFLAGNVRKASENTEFVCHLPFIPEYTLADSYTADELQKISNDLRHFENKIANFYARKLDKTFDEMLNLMREDRYMSANEALSMGFVTEIKKTIKAYAYVKLNKNNDMNEVELKKEFSLLKDGLKAIKNLFAVKNLVLQDVNGIELNFGEGKTEEDIVEGLTGVTADGSPASGVYTMPNGDVLTIEAGTISKKIDKPAEEVENEKVEELEKEKKELTKEVENLKVENAKIKADFEKQFSEYFAKFEAFSKNFSDGQVLNISKPATIENKEELRFGFSKKK